MRFIFEPALQHKGEIFEICSKLYGEHYYLPILAATTAAFELGVSIGEIQQKVSGFNSLFGRCSLHSVSGGPQFILDTAKAPYETLGLAFDVICATPNVRKWIVLGQISDYRGNPRTKYRTAYKMASIVADRIVFVGEHSHRSGAKDSDLEDGRFRNFPTFLGALKYIQTNAAEGDLILIKGSQGMHLERIALSFDHDVQCLEEKCGYDFDCMRCGLFGSPFSEHTHLKNRRLKNIDLQKP